MQHLLRQCHKCAELTTSHRQCLFNTQNSCSLQVPHRAHLFLLSGTGLNNHHQNHLNKNKDAIFKVERVYSLLAKTTSHLQTGIVYVSCTEIPSATRSWSKQVQAFLQIQNTHFVKIRYFLCTHFTLMPTEVV